LRKFEGDSHGDDDAWEAHIKVEIRDVEDEQVRYPLVTISWGGSSPGSRGFEADKDGKIDVKFGEFSDTEITFRVTSVSREGFAYQPGLNQDPSSIVIEGD